MQAIPVLVISIFPRAIGAAPSTVPALPTAFAGLACLAMAWAMAWARPRYRHASQALRLFAGALVLLIPAFVLYPSVHHFADRGLRRHHRGGVRTSGARSTRRAAHKSLRTCLQQIDRRSDSGSRAAPAADQRLGPGVFAVVARRSLRPSGSPPRSSCTDPTGLLVSRFALNLPAYVPATQRWQEPTLRVGDLRRGFAIRIGRAPALPCRPRHLRRQLRHPDRRLHRRQRDARLRCAAVHRRAQSVQRADSARRARCLRKAWPAARCSLSSTGGGAARCIRRTRARGRSTKRCFGVIAQSRRPFWTTDERWRARLLHLHPERSRRNLRDRLSGHHAHGSPDQPGRARHARRPHVCACADSGVVRLGARRNHGVFGPGTAARGSRELLPKAVPGLPRRVGAAGHGAGDRDPHVLRAAAPVERPVRCGQDRLCRTARGRRIRRAAAARDRARRPTTTSWCG